MTILTDWAAQWGVPREALADLARRQGAEYERNPEPVLKHGQPVDESHVQSLIRLEAARAGLLLMRNNVGQLMDDRGVPVRYGLMNESEQLNAKIKSSDLIGIRPIRITSAHIGTTIGQFVAREVKRTDWVFKGNAHELAQQEFLTLVNRYGGDAKFARGCGSI